MKRSLGSEPLYTVVVVVNSLSHVQLLATPWTVALQALLSLEFSRQEYWNGLSFPPPGNLPDSGIKPGVCSHYSSHGQEGPRIVDLTFIILVLGCHYP